MDIKILKYTPVGTPNLIGTVDIELNGYMKFMGCGHYTKAGQQGVGLPLKKIGWAWQGVCEFTNPDDEKTFRQVALEAVEEYLRDNKIEGAA